MTDRLSPPVGFNNQTYYDPFFPSIDSEENLVPVQSDHSPAHQSLHSPSPPHTLEPNDAKAQSAAGRVQRRGLSPSPLSNGDNYRPSLDSHINNDGGSAGYGFLSPKAYISDNGYSASSEHTATPEYVDSYLEDDYSLLDNQCQEITSNDIAPFERDHLPRNSADFDNSRKDFQHRASTGTATLSSSHLMSPVLTDAPGSSTRDVTASPADANSLFAEAPPNGKADLAYQTHQNMQETPTNSSKRTSPDMLHVAPNIVRAPSPVIRVDQYGRGDSPARLIDQDHAAKRSRAGSRSSHLAVQDDDGLSEEEDDLERFERRTTLDPNARNQISNVEIPNLKDQQDSAERALKNADVVDWLDRSASESGIGLDIPPEKPRSAGEKQRATSAGAQVLSRANLEALKTKPADFRIVGPGVLLDESSGGEASEEEEEDDDEIASIGESPMAPPTVGLNDISDEARPSIYNELPKQPPLYRAKLWQDQLYDSSDPGVKMQPVTSNEAIKRFEQRAGDIDTVSRVATWGTRRMSESDMHSLFSRLTFNSEKSADPGKTKRDRSGSILQQAAAKLVSRKPSIIKRKESEQARDSAATRPGLGHHSRTSSGENRKDSGLTVPQAPSRGLQRMGSLGKRPKSPTINTGCAVATMAGQMAALGSSSPLSATATSPPPGCLNGRKNVVKRPRSRTDLNNTSFSQTSATEHGLADLWTKQGGPPMPALVAPKTHEPTPGSGFDDDDDECDAVDDHGVKMDLSIKADPIVPTLEGFKANIRQLNPRLPTYMFHRIAQEQLRRFKKLMDFKIKHVRAVSANKCSSGKHCTETGGEPTYLPSKAGRDPEVCHNGFSVPGLGPSDDDVNALADGIVTPAQFPPGVPMPPVNRLPAEFECSLCFKVKKFQKPSDWSKHVHEDVQPFTCTFANCAEPKSFKRKADWVRHENERHRQLEWWQCSMNDCNHKCYRKDNFVQHLVREHKLPEPKVKTAKAGKPAVRGPSSQKARSAKKNDAGDDPHDEVDQVWKLVEECRHETLKNAQDEPCKFCGNICNSWKKLTVHLAKHMEQISMPVLGILKQKEVTPETIISPIEQYINSQAPSMSPLLQDGSNSLLSVSGVTMPDIPGGFITLSRQPSSFNNTTSKSHHQRVPSNTYPIPGHQQQTPSAYAPARRSPQVISDYNHYGGSPSPQFNTVHSHRAFSAQGLGSEDTYGRIEAPTSQPRSSPYGNGNIFQYVSQPEQQAFSPVEGSVYQFGDMRPTYCPQQQARPPTSHPSQSQMDTASVAFPQQNQMGGQVRLGFDMGQMQGFAGNSGSDVYGPHGRAAFADQL